MSSPVEKLKDWFDGLPTQDQRDVLDFLYGGRGKMLITDGMYLGPRPNVVNRGLHLGPVPASGSNVCPSCGKPW